MPSWTREMATRAVQTRRDDFDPKPTNKQRAGINIPPRIRLLPESNNLGHVIRSPVLFCKRSQSKNVYLFAASAYSHVLPAPLGK